MGVDEKVWKMIVNLEKFGVLVLTSAPRSSPSLFREAWEHPLTELEYRKEYENDPTGKWPARSGLGRREVS